MYFPILLAIAVLLSGAKGIRIVLSNDDGWAEMNIRTLFDVVTAAGHQVVLSAPADDRSGSGPSDSPPTEVGARGCEFGSCPAGSPPTGSNSSDARLNYVNSFPATSMKTGIRVTAPELWNGSKPELALSGFNVGNNLGLVAQVSGTAGAAAYAVKEADLPALAFSGQTGSPTAWNASTPLYAKVYAELALKVTTTIIDSGTPYLPRGTWLNVNFSPVAPGLCENASDFQYIFSRMNTAWFSSDDTEWCGTHRLPTEHEVMKYTGCHVSISPGDAKDMTTVNDVTVQQTVIEKLKPILTCHF